MLTALYEGRRVQVVGEEMIMTFYQGKAYPNEATKLVIIREIGANIVSGIDSTTGVEPDELSDYQEIDDNPNGSASDWYKRTQR